MLVKKVKCAVCGANKLTQNSSMYIYCDFCGMWMGLDLSVSTTETMNVFTPENMNKPEIQEFLAITPKIQKAALDGDIDAYVELQCRFHELEFTLFPNRFGPKAKQPAYRARYLNYYKAYYTEVSNTGQLNNYQKPEKDYVSNLKYEVVDGKLVYEFNNDFKEFIDYNISVVEKSFERNSNLQAIRLHPEESVHENMQLMKQISILSMLQAFSRENTEQIVEYLGLKHEFIEIPDVKLQQQQCKVCNNRFDIPEGCDKTVCENCGCINKAKSDEIQCLNCGAMFNPTTNHCCAYCGGRVEVPTGMGDVIAKTYAKVTEKSPQPQSEQKESEVQKPKKSFFSGLFGK